MPQSSCREKLISGSYNLAKPRQRLYRRKGTLIPVVNMASRMAVAQPRERVEIVPVLLTSERYRQSEADKVVLPEGAVRATLRQATLWYQNDEGFRNDIWNNGFAWASKKGLRTDGFHEILQDGDFKKISKDSYYKLPPENRSYHCKGRGLVVIGGYVDRYGGFDVGSGVGAEFAARVAYVQAQAGREAAAPQFGIRLADGVTPTELREAARAAKIDLAELARTTKPELLENLADVLRGIPT